MSLRKLQQIIKVAGALALGAVLSFLPLFAGKKVQAVANSYQTEVTADKATAARGDVINYTLRVTNDSASILHDFIITDTLPEHTTYNGGSSVLHADGTTYPLSDEWLTGSDRRANVGNLNPAQSLSVTFAVTVNGDAPADFTLRNTGFFKCTELPDWTQKDAFVTVKVPEAYRMQAGIEVDKKTAHRGDTLRYTAQVKNTGEAILNDVYLVDYLAKHVIYKNGSTSFVKADVAYPVVDGWILDEMGVNLGSLALGETVTLYFNVVVKNDAPNGAKLDNIMFFKSKELDNTQCLAQTVVEVSANGAVLSIDKKVKWENGDWMDSIEKGAHGHVFAAGEKVFYQIVIQNTGDESVDNMKIEDILPEYIQINDNTTVVTMVGRLDPGQSKTYEFEAKVKDAPSGERKQENVAKLKSGDEEKARDLAYVWIAGGSQSVLGEQAPTKLPEAGAETLVMSITGSLGLSLIGIGLRRRSEAIAIS